MYFPSKLTILGREFKLIFQDGLVDEGRTLGGMVDFGEMIIYVDSGMTERNQWVALFHECVHVGCDVAGVDQVLNKFAIEVICQTLANTFYDLVMSFQPPKKSKRKKIGRR